MKTIVKDVFQLTMDGFSLPTRLERARFPLLKMDTREIREINKVANYWRICHSLAHLSRSYRTKLQLETINPYAPSVRSGSSKTRFVHAEVQMLVFYETSQLPVWPCTIGASKEACFLCNSFVKAHGYFYVSKAHCQMYPQWTIPDLEHYSAESLERLQKTLAVVNRDVTNALRQAGRNRNARSYPLQSSVNLHKPRFPTPSMTAIRSSDTERTSETTGPPLEILKPALPDVEFLELNLKAAVSHLPPSALSLPFTLSKSCIDCSSVTEAGISNKDPSSSLC
jgi:hypothetical protein